MKPQGFKWVQHLPTSWQLENVAGLKVWLWQTNRKWYLSIGDENDFDIVASTELTAKLIAINRVQGYLQDFLGQLQSARGRLMY